MADSPKPKGEYGSHEEAGYADPGLQSDGKPRYPTKEDGKLSPERIRAAWGYINHKQDAAAYSPGDLERVKANIKSAAKRAGVTISESSKSVSSVRMFTVTDASPRITPPKADGTYFYTAGRLLSYFPNINRNGMTFFREDCKDLAQSLYAATADIQHVKPGYPGSDPLKTELKNTIFSAILDVDEHEDGIDIVCKAERIVASAMGFDEDDFGPGGKFGCYSQECDFLPDASSWIVVDQNDPSKIVKEVSYTEGLDLGFRSSHVGANGEWNYFRVEGNPVYVRLRPLAFTGVGHVITPADASAEIYKLAASLESVKELAGVFPGMDDPTGIPQDMLSSVGTGDDLGPFATDFLNYPDLRTASLDSFSNKDDQDEDAPDDHYAACWSTSDFQNQVNGQPSILKHRSLRIKNKNGNLDRNRLVVAYHALTGMRGNTTKADAIPPLVRGHALDIIRQGLKNTKPKQSKETSSLVDIEKEYEALKVKEQELLASATSSEKELASLKTEMDTIKAEYEKAVASKDEEINALKAAVSEYKEKELSAERLSALEAVLPYSEEDRKADSFQEFTKSLAALSEDGLKIAILERELKKASSERKALSSHDGGLPAVDPVGVFDLSKAIASLGTDADKPATAIGFVL